VTEAFTRSRHVDHPTDDVWRELTAWDRAAGWLGVDAISADGPTAVGTRLTFRTRGKEHVSVITALDPGRSMTLRSVQGGVTADYTYTLAPDGAGSRLTLTADVRTRGPWTLLAPIVRTAMRRTDGDQLGALQRQLADASAH
jgi:uncharacterized protein YndB with AHSA1/START domain